LSGNRPWDPDHEDDDDVGENSIETNNYASYIYKMLTNGVIYGHTLSAT
jgi:hypothetical protein